MKRATLQVALTLVNGLKGPLLQCRGGLRLHEDVVPEHKLSMHALGVK